MKQAQKGDGADPSQPGAQSAVAEGITLEEAKASILLPDWRTKFAGEGEALMRAFDKFVLAPAVDRAFRQAQGEDPPEWRA